MILLSAQNLSKTYLERTVLNDVSFFLNEGDRVGQTAERLSAPKASGFLTYRKFQILQNMAASWNKSWHICQQT